MIRLRGGGQRAGRRHDGRQGGIRGPVEHPDETAGVVNREIGSRPGIWRINRVEEIRALAARTRGAGTDEDTVGSGREAGECDFIRGAVRPAGHHK